MNKGKITYRYNMKSLVETPEEAIINLGDNAQTFGIEVLYEMLGYSKEDIKEINMYNLNDFSGERTIVPMNAFFSSGIKSAIFPTSKDIFPLFIGFHCNDEKILDNVNYFKKYEPIGCRDEYTKELLSERGVESYISGCVTIMMPKRSIEPKRSKTFFVDIPDSLEKYIPKKLKENCEYVKHVKYVNTLEYTEEDRKENDKFAREIFEKYKNEATLVVTSRLHCAVPCLAMGIPVIIVKENIDYRFGWLDKFVPIYDLDEFDKIDWNAKAVDLEHIKRLLYSIFRDRLNNYISGTEFDSVQKSRLIEIDKFYQDRNKSKYNNQIIKNVRLIASSKSTVECLIWGAGRNGGLLYKTIKDNFPNIIVKGFVDSFKEGKYKNLDIINPDDISKYKYDHIFIATVPGRNFAEMKLEAMNSGKDKNYSFLFF